MPHPPGAFPLFNWFTAHLVPSRVDHSLLGIRILVIGGIAGKLTVEEIETIQILKRASPLGPDLRFRRRCRAISRLH